eukprot:scaffold2428_cov412-Prasinococcus_capsulatus_cf.AAC.18
MRSVMLLDCLGWALAASLPAELVERREGTGCFLYFHLLYTEHDHTCGVGQPRSATICATRRGAWGRLRGVRAAFPIALEILRRAHPCEAAGVHSPRSFPRARTTGGAKS